MRMNNKLQLVIKNTHPWSEHLEAKGSFNFSFEEKKMRRQLSKYIKLVQPKIYI